MIWLKVLGAFAVAVLSVAFLCLLILILVLAVEMACGWLLARWRACRARRRAPAVPVERDDFALWEAECASFLQRLANRIKR